MELGPEVDEANHYQEERAELEEEDDEDWWNEFCVPDPEETVEEVEEAEEEIEEFEELLNWIDNEMDLEVARDSKPPATHAS
jgi:hypothetical protein